MEQPLPNPEQNSIPPEPSETPAPAPEQKTPTGPIIGALIIIAILAFGAFYFWSASLSQQDEQVPLILGDDGAAEESGLPQQGTSDDPAAIEADANSTSMTEFEMQMEQDMQIFEEEFSN